MSANTITADVFLDFGGQRHQSSPLVFNPNETKVVSIAQLLGALNSSPSEASEGGITIIQRGANPSLIAQGRVVDSATGFSSTIEFPDPARQPASAVDAVGLPIGAPAADSPYAGAGSFTPHVILRNLLDTPQTATITVEYPKGASWNSGNGPGGPQNPQVRYAGPLKKGQANPNEALNHPPHPDPSTLTGQLALPPVPVAAYSTADYSLAPFLSALPAPIEFCTIRIQYSGAPGSMIAQASSVDARQDLVVDAKTMNEGDGWAGSGGNPWHLDKNTESVLFLTDEGATPTRIGLSITAEGVHYYLTELQLAPGETRAINIRQLIGAQIADFKGNKIPADAADGSVNWIRLDNVPVSGRVLVVNRGGGIASNYDCCDCPCPPGSGAANMLNVEVDPSSAALAVGNAVQFTATIYYWDCNYGNYTWDGTDAALWGVTPSSGVASVSQGYVTATGGGTATVSASYTDCTDWNTTYNDNGDPVCGCLFYDTYTGSATVTATPVLTSVSPSAGLIGANTSVTLSGQGFGSSPTVNAGSGITVTVNSATSTSISATFNVSSSAPHGNNSVTVTASGETSGSVNFYVQVPTSLSIVSGTDSTTSEATCPAGGSTGCGVVRSFTYQVNDQAGAPISGSGIASLQIWDAITTTSPNGLGLTGYTTTCSPANTGPCGQYVNSSGQFQELGLGACSTVCISNNACIVGGPTGADQTWNIGPFSIVQQISYYCS